jgi:predicted acylesterase/phospholipase RssA
MADVSRKLVEVGIVLQGGGALGAYECGGIAALFELMDAAQKAGQTVTLKSVVGVSVGAINAACIVGATDRADARRRIDALWDDLTLIAPGFWTREAQRDLSLFGLPGFYRQRTDFLSFAGWTSYYDTAPLRATLERHVDFDALNASETFFVVTAVDINSGELTRFSNRPIGADPATKIAPEHVMASGSLPPQFPWTSIGGRNYWDGGLVDNAPLGDAIDAFSHGDDVARILVVMDLYPLRARLPHRLADVEDRMHELSFGNRVRQDRETASRINKFLATIDELAALLPPAALTGDLSERISWARSFKTIQIVDVDMQNPKLEGRPRLQDPSDDEFGLRDFSQETVSRRRADGYRLTRDRLAPIFAAA